MKIVITLSLFFLILLDLRGQEFPGLKDIIVDSSSYTPVHRYKAVGLSYWTTRDEALSPLRFEGFGTVFTTTSWKYKSNWLWQSAFTTQIQLLQNNPASSTLSEMGFSYVFSPLKELTDLRKNSWRFWVGPEADMFLNLRLHSRNVNNVASYDWATALGISSLVSNKFELWGRSFAISNQLRIPLLFLYARPPYAWSIPPGIYEDKEGAWTEAFKLGTLNRIMSLENQLNFDFFLKKRRKGKLVQYQAFRLSYCWNYFQVNAINKVQTGGHVLSFSRALSF